MSHAPCAVDGSRHVEPFEWHEGQDVEGSHAGVYAPVSPEVEVFQRESRSRD